MDIYNNNKCLSQNYELGRRNSSIASNDQAKRDNEYFEQTRLYYRLLKYGLPPKVRDVGDIYFASWHVAPRYMTIYAAKMADIAKNQ